MKIKNLNLTPTIRPSFTPEQWQLYTASVDCTHAARELNETLAEAVNAGNSRSEVQQKMSVVMKKNAYFGACDSEPRWFLEDVLDEIYGKES